MPGILIFLKEKNCAGRFLSKPAEGSITDSKPFFIQFLDRLPKRK
ncbi:hypothetical protein LEP1GSC058_3088 [Leptospira fainei serovar Hurstbridge str. BUT 6]|uniref:Uncharacterized protein n=1 Tax=Leptospira fainei serovar Hurstbridge str. BUT 6 TaxID=1193011 RepID=S3VA65_9LEPT|nr:hypothetical protein LEP1GSC058_3088 [Leptospira fainei serovar Hurstbridge str. BUT 6]